MPFSWADMAQWASLTATAVRPAEWRILRAMDQAYLAACREQAAHERAAADNPHTQSERPMTPDLFDALF